MLQRLLKALAPVQADNTPENLQINSSLNALFVLSKRNNLKNMQYKVNSI